MSAEVPITPQACAPEWTPTSDTPSQWLQLSRVGGPAYYVFLPPLPPSASSFPLLLSTWGFRITILGKTNKSVLEKKPVQWEFCADGRWNASWWAAVREEKTPSSQTARRHVFDRCFPVKKQNEENKWSRDCSWQCPAENSPTNPHSIQGKNNVCDVLTVNHCSGVIYGTILPFVPHLLCRLPGSILFCSIRGKSIWETFLKGLFFVKAIH